MFMKAYCMEEKGRGRLVSAPVPEPASGEVRIRTAYCGICGSDLHAYHGHHVRRSLPLIPGHETCGVIDAIGKGVEGLEKGAPVVVLPERGCGQCDSCRAGWTNVCNSKTLLGTAKWPGGFAEYFCASAENVHLLPSGMPIKLAALVEPLAVVVRAVRQARFEAGQSMALFGVGGIGSLVLALCRLKGASRTVVCDLKDFNLSQAREQGADVALNTSETEAPAQFEALKICMVDAVFVAASHHDLINQSFRLARPHGVVLLLGQFNKPGIIDIDKSRLKEQHIIGSFTYSREDFREAISLLSSHREVFLPLISREITLDEVDETINSLIAETTDAVKVVANLQAAP